MKGFTFVASSGVLDLRHGKVVLNGYTIRSSIVGMRIDLEEALSFAAEG
jgi:D-arabinose 1-dehydrogenase-like Zn-dependent alcohol dehydrogenase